MYQIELLAILTLLRRLIKRLMLLFFLVSKVEVRRRLMLLDSSILFSCAILVIRV